MQVAAKPVQVVVVEAEEEEEAGSPVTWIAYTLALAWLISYACFLWVESLPTQLPCAWGIHGCAPHSLCEAQWPPSLFSRPSCEQLVPRMLPRNHPPLPGGAGLCAAALASMGTLPAVDKVRNQGPPRFGQHGAAPASPAPEHASGRSGAPARLGQSANPPLVLRWPANPNPNPNPNPKPNVGACFRHRHCPLAAVAPTGRGRRGSLRRRLLLRDAATAGADPCRCWGWA